MGSASLVVAAVVFLSPVASALAQDQPATRWVLGLGIGRLHSGNSPGWTFLGVSAGLSRTVGSGLGFEVEGRLSEAGDVDGQAICIDRVDGGECFEKRTLVPSTMFVGEVRVMIQPASKVRLSAGPALAFSGTDGLRSNMIAGVSGGVGFSPVGTDRRNLAVELRGTRFLSSLGEMRWAYTGMLVLRF
jgi:hypothetical protein